MRTRATLAAVSGALAVAALVAPAARAADSGSSHRAALGAVLQASGHGRTAFTAGTRAAGAPYELNVTFSNFKIGKAYKVGPTSHVSIPVSYTLTHGADVDVTAPDFETDPYLYKGSFDDWSNLVLGDAAATCSATSSTVAACKGRIDIYAAYGDLENADAGSWTAAAEAIDWNGQLDVTDPDISKIGIADQGGLAKTLVQRTSTLTVNASPEPVKKGGTITVTGKLSRANWETNKYGNYTGQSVKLQFRKKGSSTYTTVRTIRTSSTGNLKTTVKASVDGYYRYAFAGNTTTPAVNAAGDCVDVR
ncbi:hypothetical protein AB0L66_06375 [Streptomyces sp. NPDC052207]|uniref:hypothetical protein n=1 Tax=Streptomyces sp. NPDC052207 TaxID=3155418 RepID=UPI0034229205